MIAGSTQERISKMAPGDVIWVEATASTYAKTMREWNLPRSRRAQATRDFVIECSVWRAVPSSVRDDVVILVRVERKE